MKSYPGAMMTFEPFLQIPENLISWISRPVVGIPSMLLCVRVGVVAVVTLRSRDWYALFISASRSGTDLSFMALGAFVSASSRLPTEAFDESSGLARESQVILVILWLLVLLGASIVCFLEAKKIGRERFPVKHKEAWVQGGVADRLAKRMLKAVRGDIAYRKATGSVFPGFAWMLAAIAVGTYAVAIVLRLFYA